jgi:Uma2 family endonuclease
VVEYANTSWVTDTTVKRPTYAQAGIPEYWIVNLNRRDVTVLWQPDQGDYQQSLTLAEGIVTPQAFPDLEVVVRRLIEG